MSRLVVRLCVWAVLLVVSAPSIVFADQPIEIGQRITLRSEILNENRALLVSLPESYHSSEFRYPVFYLLDGDSEFVHTVGLIQFLAGTGQIPEIIVVGVTNTVRSRDLTPESEDTEETAFWPAVGGADRFLEFFEEELIPYVDECYRTVPYRILRGQSFGGLLAIHDYMGPAPIFDAYLTSSPAVGWNFGTLLDRAPAFFERGVPRPLYVAASGRDFPGNLANIQRFAGIVEGANPADDNWRFDFFETEAHYSLVHRATYGSLRFLYDGWQVPDEVASQARFEDYEQHFGRLSAKYGYEIEIPMRTVIQLGNQLLRDQRFDDGIRVHEKNLDLYPDQPESHWHVGEAYLLSGRLEEARPFLEVAWQLAREKGLPDVDDYRSSLDDLDARLTGAASQSSSSDPADLRPLTPERRSELLEIVRAVHRAQENTGLALVLMHRGKVVLEDYQGMAVVEHEVPVTADTRFLVMSVTKAFTGAALARAVVRGRVDLDEPIQVYLPDYPKPEEGVLTLRALAAHLAGLPHEGHPERAPLYVQHFADATDAMRVYRDGAFTHVPGTEYAYSSNNYNLLAAVLERVTGESIQELVRAQVLDPISLHDTGHDDATAIIPHKARNYTSIDVWTYQPLDEFQEVPVFDYSFNPAGGGMYSTARDMARFGGALVRPGHFSEQELGLMRTRLVTGDPESPWSAGWFVGEDEAGRPRIHITGAAVGVQAGLYVYPEQELVIATVANAWGRGSAGGELVMGAPIRLVDAYLKGVGANSMQGENLDR